ncbi:MAG: pyrophosphatase PpaX [Clostridia bacterium]|nr:pyrophosphatase PpaX [Clostridia bacterium]
MDYIKAVLFDFDGTLMDTTHLIIESFKHTIRKHLHYDIDAESLYPSFGRPLIDALEELAPNRGKELITTYRQFNLAHHDAMVKIFDKVPETLEALKKKNLKLGIVTSKARHSLKKGLDLYDLEPYFDAIVALEDTTQHKPHPEPLLRGLELLQVLPSQALYVGDSPHDIKCAHRAGVRAVAVRWSYLSWETILAEKPEFIIEAIDELLAIVDQGTSPLV